MKIDLNKIKKIYFIGLKGVAMSGLALICQKRGLAVSGSDVKEKFITDEILKQAGIKALEGFNPSHLDNRPDLAVIGTSWGQDNPEVAAVLERQIPFITDSELRGLLSREKRTVAVTGVHGKTTTTALLAYLFDRAGLRPSYLIGTGTVADLPANAGWFSGRPAHNPARRDCTAGRHFIVEGDEYAKSQTDKSPKFLDLDPAVSVITSLEWEHVDVFRDLAVMEEYFKQLIEKTKDLVVACGDWESINKIIVGHEAKVATYGFGEHNKWQAFDLKPEFDQTSFKVRNEGKDLGEFSLKLFGEHNVLNALAAIIVGLNEGIGSEKIREIIKDFSGTQRRFEVKENNGLTFVDDYAHHPTEIKTTLKAIAQRYSAKKIYCVFQPHTVSRTKALLADFAESFGAADEVIIADIFASAREPVSEFTSKDLAAEIKKHHANAVYGGGLSQIFEYLKDKIEPGAVVVTMGAGDVYRVRDRFIE